MKAGASEGQVTPERRQQVSPKILRAKAHFRAELKRTGLSQRALAQFLGTDATTVNRWKQPPAKRPDWLEVPRYAFAFLAAYLLLPAQSRRRLCEQFRVKANQPNS